MPLHLQLVSVLISIALLVLVFELVRRKRLSERYALLWLASALAILALAAWSDLLELVAEALGIRYSPSALFFIALGFVLLLLLHFSVAVSRLADQTRVLAQRLALVEERLPAPARAAPGGGEGAPEEPPLELVTADSSRVVAPHGEQQGENGVPDR